MSCDPPGPDGRGHPELARWRIFVTALHVVVRVDGDVTDDETVLPPRGSRVPFPQPWEKAMTTMNGASALDISAASAIGKPGESAGTLTRVASTRFVPGPAPRSSSCACSSSRAA